MGKPGGTLLLVIILLACLILAYRRVAPVSEEPPAFFVEKRAGILVGLGEGFPRPGIHQFSDDTSPGTVISVTVPGSEPAGGIPSNLSSRLMTGEELDIFQESGKILEIKRTWLPAGQRIALGIPLHPDRMDLQDWEILPGIGPKLARAIEMDRHENGDFGSLRGLERVRGIGPRRIQEWEEFFK